MSDRYKSIEHLKSHARFYPAGRIVPAYLLKTVHAKTGKKCRKRHHIRFGSNAWVLHRNGVFAVYLEHVDDHSSALKINIKALGNQPWAIQGQGCKEVLWQGTFWRPDRALPDINNYLFGRLLVEVQS